MAEQLALFEIVHRDVKPAIPSGFVRGSLPGTIAPTAGSHEGVPMLPESALAQQLIDVANLSIQVTKESQ